jgi:indole-3-pyruvate monooxygenase
VVSSERALAVRRTETLVIGASAAGLATAAELKRRRQSFELLEASNVVGNAWRHHYDRLHLHTPKSISALPGLRMPDEWPRYPSRDQVVEYLDGYRDHFELQPHYGQHVRLLERDGGDWVATTDDTQWRSRQVVVATGAARAPVRPHWPGMDDYRGTVLHSSEYRNGDPWRDRPVLVVGFGNSACEQAIDLVERGAEAHLSVRSPVNVVPRDVLGVVPVLQLGIIMSHLPSGLADLLGAPLVRLTVGDLGKVGLRKLPYGPNTQIARDHQIPLLDIGTMAHLRAGDITVHGDLVRFTERGVVFDDGTELEFDAVVLATGYRPEVQDFLSDWRTVCDDDGRPRVSGGPSALPGLYFCGQFVAASGMLREIALESRRIAAQLAAASV